MKDIFQKRWIEQMTDSICHMYPSKSKETIRQFVKDKFRERFQDKDSSIHNNYRNEIYGLKLSELIDWIETNKPICAGYGVFYYNQEKAMNPNAMMLLNKLNTRAAIKKQLKLLDSRTYEYAEADREQEGEKRIANSFYGVSLSPVSAFYNRYVGVSVTASGQSLLSTTETAFEAFIAGGFLFYGLDDFVHYCKTCLEDQSNLKDYPLEDVSRVHLYRWLAPRVKGRNATSDRFIEQYIANLSQGEVNRIYYVNNLFALLAHEWMHTVLIDIFSRTTVFKDAGSVPLEIVDSMETLWSIVEDIVYYKGFFFDRIYRFKEDERKAVVLCDTDSDMMTVDRWVQYMREHIYAKSGHPDDDNSCYIAVSVKAYLLSEMIKRTLRNYTRSVHILDEYSPRINMKNEYLFSRIALAATKKRYVCFQKLREGKEFPVPKFDAKGVDFLKSTTRTATRSYLEDICKKDILVGEIDINHVRSRLKDLEDIIRQSLERGEKDYLTPANVKEMGGYKNPFQTMGLLAVLAWNTFYPDNTIELPEIVDVLKVKLDQKSYIEKLEKEQPDRFAIFQKHYIHPMIPEMKGKFIGAIAIPRSLEKVPDWIIPYIDYETIVRDNIGRFNSVRESLDIVDLKLKGGVTEYSNILNI